VIVLVTGPVRAGKSAYALQLAREHGGRCVYVATYDATPGDPEMAERIARHRTARGDMAVIETNERAGPSLAGTLAGAPAGDVLIVDSVGTWLAALLFEIEELAERDPVAAAAELERRAAALPAALDRCAATAVVVSEEAGWGVVPGNVLGRLFRDQLGRTTAEIAGRAEHAYLVVAGYAVDLAVAGRRVSG
jgi:adenosylcobinamide kinase/adenosylcobinamide-phosphate guanylyltransferase